MGTRGLRSRCRFAQPRDAAGTAEQVDDSDAGRIGGRVYGDINRILFTPAKGVAHYNGSHRPDSKTSVRTIHAKPSVRLATCCVKAGQRMNFMRDGVAEIVKDSLSCVLR